MLFKNFHFFTSGSPGYRKIRVPEFKGLMVQAVRCSAGCGMPSNSMSLLATLISYCMLGHGHRNLGHLAIKGRRADAIVYAIVKKAKI